MRNNNRVVFSIVNYRLKLIYIFKVLALQTSYVVYRAQRIVFANKFSFIRTNILLFNGTSVQRKLTFMQLKNLCLYIEELENASS